MKTKKGEITGEEVVKIVLAVIGISLLIGLTVLLYNGFGKTETKQASATLEKIIIESEKLSDESQKQDIIIESPNEWYLTSTELGNNFCGNNFCLCLCKDKECNGQTVCKATEKFILLRNEKGGEVRVLEQKAPFGAELTYKEGTFYPFNAEENLKVTPLFYRFNKDYSQEGRWEWSPDLINWMSIEENIVRGGVWNGKKPSSANENFINAFNSIIKEFAGNLNINYEEKGKEFLGRSGVKESKAVVIFQVKQ